MNTPAEIEQTFADYQRTGLGCWPCPRNDTVHPHGQQRFARRRLALRREFAAITRQTMPMLSAPSGNIQKSVKVTTRASVGLDAS